MKALAERDRYVFGRVVIIDVQIAFGAHRDIDQRVARQLVEHMVKETHAGLIVIAATAVEIDLDRDVGFGGGAGQGAATHRASPKAIAAPL